MDEARPLAVAPLRRDGEGDDTPADFGCEQHDATVAAVWAAVAADTAAAAPPSPMRRLGAAAHKHWFLLGMLVAVAAAALFPRAGKAGAPFYPEIVSKYILVFAIFLMSGLSLKTAVLARALTHWRFHLYFHAWVFVVMPVLWFVLAAWMRCCTAVNRYIVDGCVVMSTLASTVSSQTALTQSAGGSDALSVLNAASTNLLGLVVSPLLVLLYFGRVGTVPVGDVVQSLALVVLLPLLLGQAIQYRWRAQLAALRLPTGNISQVCLLLILFFTFASAFDQSLPLSLGAVVRLAALLIVVHACCQCAVLLSARWAFLRTSRADVAAALFGASHKSLAVGLPLLRIMYAGSPHLALLTLPLLLQHPLQIGLSSLLVPRVRAWIAAEREAAAAAATAELRPPEEGSAPEPGRAAA